MKEFEKILEIANIATVKLQSKSLLLSDFFAIWTELKLSLQKYPNYNFAKTLLNQIESREENLIDELVFGAVYLDGRYSVLLSADQAKIAEDFLVLLWNWITQLKLQHETSEVNNNSAAASVPDEAEETVKKSVLEEYMESLAPNVQILAEETDIRSKITAFRTNRMLPMNTNILMYWEENKHTHPELYAMSIILNGVPATEVRIEQSFSQFAFIFNEKRTSMDPKNLNNILLIRLNKEIFNKIC